MMLMGRVNQAETVHDGRNQFELRLDEAADHRMKRLVVISEKNSQSFHTDYAPQLGAPDWPPFPFRAAIHISSLHLGLRLTNPVIYGFS
jgi:hypothetical protein